MNTPADDPRNPHLDDERLNDFVDHRLSDVESAQVNRHLDTCAPCRAAVAELLDLLARTAELPLAVAPPHDLWAGIQARCAAEAAGPAQSTRANRPRLTALPPAPPRPRERHPLVRYWMPLAAAAVALIVLSSSITNVLMKPGGLFAPPAGAPAAAANRVLLPRVAQTAALQTGALQTGASEAPALGTAEDTFEKAAADLRTAFEARKGTLKPQTVATVEENLRIIDDAIRRSRAALEADPGNPELNAMVTATWQKKVELLEKAVRLSSEI